jgi:diguanylate cyclase (GGDEF)-like protein
MKILVVEDSPTLRQTMCAYIKRAGHDAMVAASGEEALQLVETTLVDLVFMDVEMPGLDGFETTKLMRESFGKHWVPIVFVTGMGDAASFEEGIDAGGDDYLIKPINPVVIKAKIRALERIAGMRDELRRLNHELEALSRQDGLTKLCNRRYFEEQAEKQWKILSRSQEPVSILMMDVDYFKKYNDSYGHVAGDRCLQAVAGTLKHSLHRPADVVARYGGEEFIAILPNTDAQGASTVAETLRRAVANLAIPHKDSDVAGVVTLSIGSVASDSVRGVSLAEMIKQADRNLYQAKHKGRNCVYSGEMTPHKTVLIVDDNKNTLSMITDTLRKRCNILTTHSGEECIEIAHNIHPDLILLDLGRSDMDGMRLYQALKTSVHTTSIPVILITATEQMPAIADATLRRPFDETLLIDKVRQFLG